MVIGLCGRMASGKSTALRIFAAHGLNVLDCDDVARETGPNALPSLQGRSERI